MAGAAADRDDILETAEDPNLMDQVETKVEFDKTKSMCHSTGIPLRAPLPPGANSSLLIHSLSDFCVNCV